MKIIFVILIIIFSSLTFAAANNDKFEAGPFDLKWNDSIQDAQFLYEGGLTYPVDSKEFPMEYALPKNLPLFWSGIPVEAVRLSFDIDGKLGRAYVQFKYSDFNAVRTQAIMIFGNSYKFKEISQRTTMYWVEKENMQISFNLNKKSPYEWVVLVAQLKNTSKGSTNTKNPKKSVKQQ